MAWRRAPEVALPSLRRCPHRLDVRRADLLPCRLRQRHRGSIHGLFSTPSISQQMTHTFVVRATREQHLPPRQHQFLCQPQTQAPVATCIYQTNIGCVSGEPSVLLDPHRRKWPAIRVGAAVSSGACEAVPRKRGESATDERSHPSEAPSLATCSAGLMKVRRSESGR